MLYTRVKKSALLIACLAAGFIGNAQSTTKTSKQINHNKHSEMENKSFKSTILVKKSRQEAMEAIKNFRGWWSEDIEGATDRVGETFFYHYKDVHLCKIKFVEEVPGSRLVYEVTDNEFSFTKDKTEWIGTKLVFEVTEEDKQTKVVFTHVGLVPEYECYNVCNDAWTGFIQKSLKDFINTGHGQPNPKDGTNEINAENIKKWQIRGAEKDKSYSFGFDTKRNPDEVFEVLSDPNKWWVGIYGEAIEGSYKAVGDEFRYRAGNGLHFSVQKVAELVPGKKIVWHITNSELSFLQKKDEWTGSSIEIVISKAGDKTHVQFTHAGLVPVIECYEACSGAWSQYMNNLKAALN